MTYGYSDNYENGFIYLHDSRATEFCFGEGELRFVFEEGFYVSADAPYNDSKKMSYTDRSEITFKTDKNVESDMIVYLFTPTDAESRSIRDEISLSELREMIDGGAQLEFLYSYKGYGAYLFDCWLWQKAEPHHRECQIIITSDSASCRWDTMHPEE